MNTRKLVAQVTGLVLLAAGGAPVLAGQLLDVQTSLVAGDPTETLRPFRDAKIATWAATKACPGTSSSGTPYHYHAYTVPAASIGTQTRVQVTLDQSSNVLFAAAYAGSYTAPNICTNYLGDEGTSGNLEPGDAAFFQATVPSGQDLVIVVNETANNNGVGQPFHLRVGGYTDTLYSGDAPLPPTNIVATPRNGKVVLTWTASAGATKYKVFQGTSPGGEGTTEVNTATSTTATIRGLTNGTLYYFKLRALGATGASALSSEVSATPAP